MSVVISDDILRQANMSEAEFRLELGIYLFQKKILSQGKASEFSRLPQTIFQLELAKRGIPVSYDQEEFDKDLATIRDKYSGSRAPVFKAGPRAENESYDEIR